MELNVQIKWDMVVYDDLCYEVYDGLVLLDDINYNTIKIIMREVNMLQ